MQLYYIISLKHTSKGDAALTFWCANECGYTWNKSKAGLYTSEEIIGIVSSDNVAVEAEKVDPFWMNALDFEDKYISVPNNATVRNALGLSDKQMKPKRTASCRMTFLNTPINLT